MVGRPCGVWISVLLVVSFLHATTLLSLPVAALLFPFFLLPLVLPPDALLARLSGAFWLFLPPFAFVLF